MTNRKTSRRIVCSCLLALLITTACASGGFAHRDRNRISTAELKQVQAMTLFHAIQRLRPHWLARRDVSDLDGPREVVVVQEQALLGGVETLRQISADDVEWLEYMDGTRAASMIRGIGLVAGAIVIHLQPESD